MNSVPEYYRDLLLLLLPQEKNNILFCQQGSPVISIFNHEGTDIRAVLIASKVSSDVAFVRKDKNIFI